MKRMLYLSLLLVIPFMLQADHGRDRLNGKWISPYFNKTIKIKVKRYEVKVKGLTGRGWTHFIPVRRNVFEDCYGNRIKIKNIHDLVYTNRRMGERIRFVKKGHRHNNHVCNSSCGIGNDYFGDNGHNHNYYGDSYQDNYYDNWDDDSYSNRNNKGDRNKRNRDNRINDDGNYENDGFNGKYHVRELDEYVTINRTNYGLRAQKGNDAWVEYIQNRNRKNEYIDKNGNKYLLRSDGQLTWKNKKGNVSLNLKK